MISRMMSWIVDNPLGSGVAVLLIGAVGGKLLVSLRNWRDRRAIYEFLASSAATTNFEFRTTTAIAAEVSLPEARVEELCASHPKIRRNAAQLQSWRIED